MAPGPAASLLPPSRPPSFQPLFGPLTISQRGHRARQAQDTWGPGQPASRPPFPTGPSQSNPALVLDMPLQPCPLGLIMAS